MSNSTWGAPEQAPRKKAPYAPKQKITESMSEAQKQGIKVWNAWHDILNANGLMEEPQK